jgi:hypothetical protein
MNVKWIVTTFFGVVGLLLLGVLVLWVCYSLATQPFSAVIPEPGGPRVMGADPTMPNKAWEDALADATAVMKAKYQRSHTYRWCSRFADWIGFLLTAAITVVVGSTGQVLQGAAPVPPGPVPPGTVPPAAAALGRRWVHRIGVMAALASVMIGVTSRVAAVSQERLDQAEKVSEAITKSHVDWAGAATPADGQKVVDYLISETAKYR